MRAALRILLLLVTSLLLAANTAHSQSLFEKLVMPGDVIEGHAKYEKTCESCHESFSKESQRRLCLDCHKDVAKDIVEKKGMHGRRADIVTVECKHCHTDHKGRKENIVQFDKQTFNHNQTDFELKGAHRQTRCEGCHEAGKLYRAAALTCIGCHKKDDTHKGDLGEDCSRCHSEDTWRKQKTYDHSKTKFPLEGAHKDVQCAGCHIGERYKNLPRACIDCHKAQDPHGGRYGSKCETCHASKKWKETHFDHSKSTKFPLKGEHTTVKCDACHKGDLYKEKLAVTCVSCHKKNDPHKGQLGSKCESCHAETGWRKKVAFDHDLTRFPLIGLHAAVPCEECHRTETYKDTPRACESCHKDKTHEGRLGAACGRCHNPNGFALWRFNHDKETKYPLTGAHKGLQCHSCHTVKGAAKVTAPSTCYACHSADDAHRGAFGRNCETCHVTETFRQRRARQ
ncbi:MAG: cytochrome c3 family protein [Hyphomicrobium sp.]